MRKLVVLKLDGDLKLGIRVTLEIGEEGLRPSTEITGQLPPDPDLLTAIDEWRLTYRSLGKSARIKAKKIIYDGSINQRRSDCRNCAAELRSRLNKWLLSESFRPIREKWLKQLSSDDKVRVLIRTRSSQMRKLPWHLWDVVEDYTKAEVALSDPECEKPASSKTPTYRDKVRILAILGNSAGINVQKDRQLLKNLPNAKTTFLVEPQRDEINGQLWAQPWDILFFAGHSKTEGDTGRIYINDTESLTIAELRYALRNAVEGGLQLAIFNSCDGLGIGIELQELHIPQMIVMREPVPDKIAQEFLTYFLAAFAGGQELYLAVRAARLKLHGLEHEFPCASWLPVIFQNSAAVPPIWEELRHPKRKVQILPSWLRLQTVLLSSVFFTVFGLRVLLNLKEIITPGKQPTSQAQLHNNETKKKINLIYQQVLGRDANSVEIAERIKDLAKGTKLSEVRGQTAKSQEAKDKINLIYQQVLGRDANSVEIAERIKDLAKGTKLSEVRGQTAKSQEAKDEINLIYQQVFGQDTEPYVLKYHMDRLAGGATLSLIHKSIKIAKTSSHLQSGDVISLECLGSIDGSKFLNGQLGDEPVVLTNGQSTDAKWRVHVISYGVIALENLGEIPDSTWLNGITFSSSVNLAPSRDGVYTGTEWKIHVIDDRVIALESQGDVPGSTWLNGLTFSGSVNLSANPAGDSGTRWKITKQ